MSPIPVRQKLAEMAEATPKNQSFLSSGKVVRTTAELGDAIVTVTVCGPDEILIRAGGAGSDGHPSRAKRLVLTKDQADALLDALVVGLGRGQKVIQTQD